MENGIREFLAGLFEGRDELGSEHLEMTATTPERVARAWANDIAAGYATDPRAALEPVEIDGASGLVVLRDLRFESVCAHHLLPYDGTADVAFAPNDRHVGLGGIARVVDGYARRLTLQEQLTARIADALYETIAPRSLLVRLSAEHRCLADRGPRKHGHRFVTIERRGEPLTELDAALRGGAARFS